MKIFIVTGGRNYEYPDIFEAYSNIEAAKERKEKGDPYCDYMDIEETELLDTANNADLPTAK